MIEVAITTYPQGGETTVYMEMPFPPRKGESVHVHELDRIVSITHVRWCRGEASGEWWVECDAE